MASLADAAKSAGIVGAGGAGFPTHVKLATPVDTIIVNGAECEPLMHGDQALMEERAADMLGGLRLVAEEFAGKTGVRPRAVICVKQKYKAALKAIRACLNPDDAIEVTELANIYPSGDEQYLVYEVTGRIVPEGGIPPMVGALVMNVGTLTQLCEAAGAGKPVTERLVTLGGEVAEPRVAIVPIGTPFSEIVPRLGPKTDDYVILVNGPMMGRLTEDLDEVTTKTTGGIFLLPKKHSHAYRMRRPLVTEIKLSKAACEVCRYCTDFCPRYLQGHALEPHKVMRVINYDRDMDTKTITSAWLCCECGLCDLWACPMFLSPRIIFREFKRRMKEAGMKNPHNEAQLEIDPHRKFRGVPTDRLTARLGLTEYDIRPPFDPQIWPTPKVRIELNRHIGAPAQPVVAAGDRVERGRLIAQIPDGALGAAYHASITGTVTAVENNSIAIES